MYCVKVKITDVLASVLKFGKLWNSEELPVLVETINLKNLSNVYFVLVESFYVVYCGSRTISS